MNEEIARILALLEQGKITAPEAEALIRAVCDGTASRPAPDSATPPVEPPVTPAEPARPSRPDPVAEVWRGVCAAARTIRLAEERQQRQAARWIIWGGFKVRRRIEQARRERAARQSTLERVIHVLEHSALAVGKPQADTRLEETLEGDRYAWDNALFGLEEEFDREIPLDAVRAAGTVQGLADYLEGRPTGAGTDGNEADTSSEDEPGTSEEFDPDEAESVGEPAEPIEDAPEAEEAAEVEEAADAVEAVEAEPTEEMAPRRKRSG